LAAPTFCISSELPSKYFYVMLGIFSNTDAGVYEEDQAGLIHNKSLD
jgi:hypothetical protein